VTSIDSTELSPGGLDPSEPCLRSSDTLLDFLLLLEARKSPVDSSPVKFGATTLVKANPVLGASLGGGDGKDKISSLTCCGGATDT